MSSPIESSNIPFRNSQVCISKDFIQLTENELLYWNIKSEEDPLKIHDLDKDIYYKMEKRHCDLVFSETPVIIKAHHGNGELLNNLPIRVKDVIQSISDQIFSKIPTQYMYIFLWVHMYGQVPSRGEKMSDDEEIKVLWIRYWQMSGNVPPIMWYELGDNIFYGLKAVKENIFEASFGLD